MKTENPNSQALSCKTSVDVFYSEPAIALHRRFNFRDDIKSELITLLEAYCIRRFITTANTEDERYALKVLLDLKEFYSNVEVYIMKDINKMCHAYYNRDKIRRKYLLHKDDLDTFLAILNGDESMEMKTKQIVELRDTFPIIIEKNEFPI